MWDVTMERCRQLKTRTKSKELVMIAVILGLCLGWAEIASALEAQILLDFKSAVSDGSGELANWSPADPTPCNWTGVRCSSGVVTELNLKDMNVSGTVPIGLGKELNFLCFTSSSLTQRTLHRRTSSPKKYERRTVGEMVGDGVCLVCVH